jgi:hypothetical protein
VLLGIAVAAGSIMWPVSVNAAFIGMDVFAGYFGGREGPGNGPATALLLWAIFLLGLAAVSASSFRRQLLQSPDVAVLAHLPVDDNAHLRRHLRDCGFSSIFIASMLAPGYGYLAWSQGFSTGAWVAAAAFAILQGFMFAAVGLLLVGRAPGIALAIVGSALMMTSGVVGFIGPLLPSLGVNLSWVGLFVLPTGWINGTFYFGLVEGHVTGWLLLVPAFGVIVLAARRAAQPFAIKELSYLPGGTVRVIPAKDWTLAAGPAGIAEEAQEPVRPVVPVAEIADRIRRRAFLAPADSESHGWVERCFARRLNRRERAIADFLLGGRQPRWTVFWQCAVWATMACLAILTIPVPADWVLFLVGPSLYLVLFLTLFGALTPPGPDLGAVPGHAVFPVGYREISRVWLKWAAVKNVLVLLPLALVYGAAAAWRCGAPVLLGLLVAVKAVYILLALLPWAIMFYYDRGIDVKAHPVRRALFLGAVILVILGYLGAGYLLFQDSALPALAGLVLLGGCAVGAWRLYEHVLHRMSVDWGQQRARP